jgi:hypothetical protein
MRNAWRRRYRGTRLYGPDGEIHTNGYPAAEIRKFLLLNKGFGTRFLLDLARRAKIFSFVLPVRDKHLSNPKFISRARRLAVSVENEINKRSPSQLSPEGFEELVSQQFERCGYRIERTLPARDGGYDIRLVHDPHGLSYVTHN